MKLSRFFLSGLVLLVIVLGLMVSANSALIDNGDGTITQTRDDGSILMWLKDANYAMTSGYDSDGKLTWNQATAWINTLNTSNYLGYNNWRMPNTLPVDGSSYYNYGSSLTYDGSTDWGYNISAPGSVYPGSTGSEIAYLYYWELGNLGWCDMSGNCPQDGWNGSLNTVPFINLQNDKYWSVTVHNPPNMVFGFSYLVGYQGEYNVNYFVNYVHAVRTVFCPTTEVCDGIDNSCDGLVDNIPSTPTTCGVGACASTGTLSCVNGAWVDSCAPGSPTTEVCDGIDNDCDGTVPANEADADNDGYRICTGDCNDSDATINPAASDAICNGIDNDCDGPIDEDYVSTPTTCGVGACASTGILSCVAGLMVDTCTPGAPTAEACDGIDNDCNGAVDDGLLIRIGAVYYSSLQTAYDSAGEGSVIQTQGVQLIEGLSANLNKTVTIDGGYDDCSYAVKTGRTRLKGQMTISNGKAAVKDFIIEQ